MPDDSRLFESTPRHLKLVPAAREPGVFWGQESFTVAGAPATVLFLSGDIDISTDPLLREVLARLTQERAASVIVDLSDVEFCSISAFAMLLDTARTVENTGVPFMLVAPSPQITRVWALIWPDASIARHPTVAAAVSAVRARRNSTPEPSTPSLRNQLEPDRSSGHVGLGDHDAVVAVL